MNIKIKEFYKGLDTGLRGNISGKMYVDKATFFKRTDVLKIIADLKESSIVKKIKANEIKTEK